ncbi:metalloregulator ArsR/SmtB family transcription factor [Sphingoaurantiacus capsulatus]|uniref:Metalloregulator ArsR/SmtB family transcription factor n=1 Tax=Sphingoaurantiacus capsulatus TaxID=1771310 RepID=A0ABV7XBE5_9SPHN
MDAIFDALASAPRRRILLYLADDDLTAGEIAARFDMSKPAISKHLQILENAGLVGSRKQGQFVRYWLVRDALVATLEGFLRRIDPPAAPPAEASVNEPTAAQELFAEQLRRARAAYAADLNLPIDED